MTTRALSKLEDAMAELEAAVSAAHVEEVPEAVYDSFMNRMSILARIAAVEQRVIHVLREAHAVAEDDCTHELRVMTDVIRSAPAPEVPA